VTDNVATPVTRHPSRVTGPLGLLGGTFDPIHHGHLRLAEEIGAALNLAEVRIMPTGIPPHRSAPIAAPHQRRAMVERAIVANQRFRLETSELDRSGPCYMVDTLETLRRQLGETRAIVLILGADAFAGLTTWRQWPRLFELCHIAIARRPGYAEWQRAMPDELTREYLRRLCLDASLLAKHVSGLLAVLTITQLDISATRIRADIAAGRNPRYLLPDAVLDYIDQQRLYM
jgi:nicotinate-nucleotide adenylyltransferase